MNKKISLVSFKLFVFLGFSGLALAKPHIECQLQMTQVDLSNAVWGGAEDSSQKLNLELNPMQSPYQDSYVGTQILRFKNAQKDDVRLSQHGVKIKVDYSSGNGLTLTLSQLEFESKDAKSKFKSVATVATTTPGADTNKPAIDALNVGVIGNSFAELDLANMNINIPKLVQQGKIKNRDLISISLSECSFKN